MSKETIFISYSRDNTEFVMNLAKNLRKAGANIWLDQLDIKVGENWDNAIQTALKSANTFLIILSKDSVASNNVMDEVGYALGADKNVIPVLIEQCEIPFRLQRRQFVDFTGDQRKGIENLIEALDLDEQVADKLSDASNRSSLTAERDLEEIKEMREADKAKKEIESKANNKVKKEATKKEAAPITPKEKVAEPTKSKSKLPIIIIVGVILAALAIWQVPKLLDKETGAFEIARTGNSEASYKAFLGQFPDGNFAKEANDSILSIQGMDRRKADNAAWNVANTEEALITYRAQYPEGIHLGEVDDKLASIRNLEADIAAWKIADGSKTFDGYIAYLTNPMVGKTKIEDAIAGIKASGKTGWLYSGRTDGTEMTGDAQFNYVWRKDSGETTSKLIPKVGDVLKAKSSLRLYSQAANRNNSVGTWARNNNGYVLQSIKEGTALILQIVTKK